jgi:hypothetical protein
MYTELVEELMGLDNDSITERFRELELERRRIEAEMAAVVAVGDARGVYGDDGHRSIKGWMRANANWSGCDVSTMRRIVALFESCPAVGDALLAGHIGQAQVVELARARSNPRCGARLVEVLELLLDNAEHLSFEDFRTVVRRWEHLADEDGTLDDAETNHVNRTAALHEVNGCVDLRASGGRPLDAAEMLGIFERFVERSFVPTSPPAPSCTGLMRRRHCCHAPTPNVASMRCCGSSRRRRPCRPVPALRSRSSTSSATWRRSRPCSPVTG